MFFHLMNFLVYCEQNNEYKKQIIELENSLISISGGESNDFIDSDCGKKVSDKMKDWLSLFFSIDVKENYLQDHWNT